MATTPPEGRVRIRLTLDAHGGVAAAEIRSQRPQPGPLLAGRAPGFAVEVIPRLYSLCGDAQTVAAEAVVRLLAEGDPGPVQPWAERIRLESLREHLWRLGMDWMALAGEEPVLPPLRELLAGKERFLRDRPAAREWARETRAALFGPGGAADDLAGDPDRLEQWIAGGEAPLAALLRRLRPRLVGLGKSRVPSFRSQDLERIVAAVLPRLRDDADFHWRPDWEGEVFEMGPLARMQEAPAVAALVARGDGADAWARVVARLLELSVELRALREGEPAAPGIAGQAADGEAAIAVLMTRGVLIHWARADAGRLDDYRIVAPTEWNFHPRGAAAEGLAALPEGDMQTLNERVKLQVMALDPCVSHELEVAHA